MKTKRHHSLKPPSTRSAFTLIEMLVSVSLVLLMMTMFATIFQITTRSMSKQRGISENDQRARSVFTVMNKDFQHRTMRYTLPYYPQEDSAKSVTAFSNRAGYLYFSMNEPDSGLDDKIQFTVSSSILFQDTDGSPYFGRVAELVDRSVGLPPPPLTNLGVNPNQPETDDGSLAANSIGSSPAAEVTYIVRNGTLYRRLMLIREPISYAGKNLAPQPTAQSGFNYFMGQSDPSDNTTYDGLFQPFGGALTDDFYRLYDYSAYATNIGGLQHAAFVGSASLSNETAGAAQEILARPTRRFGFNPVTGLSREHTGPWPSAYLGTFLQAETSTGNFNWPQGPSTVELPSGGDSNVANGNAVLGNGNPFDVANMPLSLNANGIVSSFDGSFPLPEGRGGVRRAEDVLLTNVHEMKVEIWDNRLQRFVTPGHLWSNPTTGETGDYHITRCLNLNYGPLGAAAPNSMKGHVFDTWHPSAEADSDANGIVSVGERNAPYIPYLFYPPRVSDNPRGPSPDTMTDSIRSYWQENQTYGVGQVVFAKLEPSTTYAGWDIDGNGIFEWVGDANGIPQPAFHLAYRCIFAGTTNATTPPTWPTAPGRRVTDGTVVWEAIDNRRPLESVRVQFRFHDKPSDTMKQLSLVIPLTDPPK